MDHNKNIQRIVDKILADPSLYDKGKTPGKLRDVFFGDPENNDKMSAPQLPYLYVTTRGSLQTTRRNHGVALPENSRQLGTEYKLVIVSRSDAKSVEAQKQMYDIIKNITALTQADPLFKKPVTNDDPVFSRSVIADVPYEEATRGKLLISVSIILLATIGNSYTLDIGGFTNIPLISKPIEREIEVTEDIYNTARERKNIPPISETHSLFAEMEYDDAIIESLRVSKRARTVIPATLKRATTTTTFAKGRITEITNGSPFDAIETFIIRYEVIH